jgi:hypothetical protein
MGKNTVSVGSNQELLWPQRCALCLDGSVVESPELGSGKVLLVPYCESCDDKVKRLANLEGGLAMLSLILAVIILLAGLIIGAIRDIDNILQSSTCAAIVIGGPMLMGIIYFLGRLILLPYQVIARNKLAKPGVRVKKGNTLSIISLVFSNQKYADLFREANGITAKG